MKGRKLGMHYSLNMVRNIIIIFAVLIYIIFYTIRMQDKEERVNILLQEQLRFLHQNYKITTHSFKTISENIYNSVLTRPDVLELMFKAKQTSDKKLQALYREQLYKIVKPYFEHLKKSGVNIILFSFPDNKTFLRMHKAKKFDDDLSKIRYSFNYVNEQQKPIHGLEQGKISHAFRNIRPLYFKDKFIGSVDVSFSSEVMQENMRRIHGIDTHFILNKNLFETNIWKAQDNVKYEQSMEHEDFLFSITKHKTLVPEKIAINKALKEDIARHMQNDKAFSLHEKVNNKHYIISFSPIYNIKANKTVAYIVSYVESLYLKELLFQYFWINMLFFIGLFLVTLLFYANVRHQFLLKDLIKEEVAKNREKDFMVMQQARQAQMGEMLSMIAHQWRQPLATISSAVNSLHMEVELTGTIELEKDTLMRISNYTQELSSTIDDFREFFKEEQNRVSVTLESIIDESVAMVKAVLNHENVTVETEFISQEALLTYPSDLKQAVLNIIKNSQDVFLERAVKDARITLKTDKDDEHYFIIIEDNGGGIKEDIIEKIFDPYFTTKVSRNGSGMGLYVARKIVQERCLGRLSVENIQAGARFTIELPRQ